MIIYNTTFAVSDKVYGAFLKWLKEKHLPQMLGSGYFEQPTVSRVLTDEEQDGSSISVQLRARDLTDISKWKEERGDLFEMEVSSLFSVEVLYFSTFMEIIEN